MDKIAEYEAKKWDSVGRFNTEELVIQNLTKKINEIVETINKLSIFIEQNK